MTGMVPGVAVGKAIAVGSASSPHAKADMPSRAMRDESRMNRAYFRGMFASMRVDSIHWR